MTSVHKIVSYLFAIVYIFTLIGRTSNQVVHKYNVIVNTQHGRVEGFTIPSHYSAYDKQRINVFLGIPYAKRISEYSDWRRQFRFNRINMFLGFPYAKRISEYSDWRRQFRFNKPERPSWSGIWDATYYRPACPQIPWYVKQTVPGFNRAQDTSEDCLYMNIFVPNKTDERPISNPSLFPVMVFIHGGGWTMGASQQYPGMFLAERKVVVVTFNYRLNALGFMSTGDNYAPGNYGLWDQQRALEFIKENIRYFRGNPGMVTLFGHSTGAASVGLHLLSPRSYNLFHQAIMMSGSDRSQWSHIPDINDAREYAQELARELGCPSNDNQRLVSCMQLYRTADEIVNASVRVRVREGTVGNPWGPVIDGPFMGSVYAFLLDSPKAMRQQGRYQKLRVMGGLLKDDGSYYIPNMPNLEEGLEQYQYDNVLLEFLRDRKVADMTNAKEALTFEYSYWPQRDNKSWIRQELIDMMTDYLFGTGMDESLRAHNLYNKTYFYVFNYKSRYDYTPTWRGIAHGQELQYVFGFPYFNDTYTGLFGVYPRQEYDMGIAHGQELQYVFGFPYFNDTYTSLFGVYPRQEYDMDYSDRNISEYVISLLTNFSDSGNPTDNKFFIKNFRNTSWLEYNLRNHSYLEISNQSTNKINYRQKQYGFWREYFVAVSNREALFGTTPQQEVEHSTDFQIATYALAVFGTTPQPEVEHSTDFQIATYALAGLSVILIVLVVSLGIAICRMRPRDY